MKLYPIFGSFSGLVVAGIAIQQSGINVSVELLISILVNVAILALAFGRIQSNVGHIREMLDDVKKEIEKAEEESKERDEEVKQRIESVAKRAHTLANHVQRILGKYGLGDKDAPEI